MENTKLVGLIRQKNERLEFDVLRTAENIIEEITREQQNIRRSNERIDQLRVELKALSVHQLDPKEVLGE